jgi:hypothetical protein
MADALSHITSIAIAAPAAAAFAFVSDPAKLDRWSFGTWKITLHAGGLVEGRAIFDDAVTWVRIDADPARLLVDYHLGASAAALTPRIAARVVPGERLALAPDSCVLTLTAWRAQTMPDERWRRLTAAHEFEIVLLKSLIEREAESGAQT